MCAHGMIGAATLLLLVVALVLVGCPRRSGAWGAETWAAESIWLTSRNHRRPSTSLPVGYGYRNSGLCNTRWQPYLVQRESGLYCCDEDEQNCYKRRYKVRVG